MDDVFRDRKQSLTIESEGAWLEVMELVARTGREVGFFVQQEYYLFKNRADIGKLKLSTEKITSNTLTH